jgi:hypothetical protein
MCSRCDFRYGLTVLQAMALLFAGWLWGIDTQENSFAEYNSLINENDGLRAQNLRLQQLVGQHKRANVTLQFGILVDFDQVIDLGIEPYDASDEIPAQPDWRPWCCLPSYTMLYAPQNARCDCHAWLRQQPYRQPNRCYGHSTLDAGTLSD